MFPAETAGTIAYRAGAFRNTATVPAGTGGTAAKNPLMILVNAVPDNLISAPSNNGGILAVVVCALAVDRLMMPGGFTAVSFLFNDDKRYFHFFPGQPGMSAEYLLSFNMRVEYAAV